MPQFRVYLSPDDVPEQIEFENQLSWRVAPIEEAYFSPEADWLCLCALYTALRRAKVGENDYCPCFSEINQAHTRTIAGAVYDDRNFRVKGSSKVTKGKSVDRKKSTLEQDVDRRHWLVKIFGERPTGKYLVGSKSPGVERLRFTEEVEIVLLEMDTNEPWRGDAQKINEVFRSFERNLLGLEKKLYVKFEIPGEDPEAFPRRVIDSRECIGNLVRDSSFFIKVVATYRTQFCLFWISSSKQIHPLYPFNRFREKVDLEFRESDKECLLTVGKSCGFQVHPPEGTDICLLLARVKKFGEKEMGELEKSIAEALTKAVLAGDFGMTDKPFMEKFSVAKKRARKSKKVATKRFGIREEPDQWKVDLIRSLEGRATTLSLFSVPNKQS